MQENPLVTVYIPTYNRVELLKRAVESVLNQTYTNLEVIIVDDCSPDNTLEYLAKISQQDSRVRYYQNETNSGACVSRNKAINEAKGEFITGLDDDDFYVKDKVEAQLKFLIENKVDVCLCNAFFYLQNTHKVSKKILQARCVNLEEFILKGNALTPMIFSKTEVVRSVGGFYDTPRFQDHVLMIKILNAGYKVKIIDKPLYYHVIHDGERISYSKKSKLGYKIKHEFEHNVLENLTVANKNYVLSRQVVELYPFEACEKKDFFSRSYKILRDIKSYTLLKIYIRQFIKLIIKGCN